ncbi:MAG: hypothetical protein GY851_06565 [bacterium]|nr:hypothetical protein [bacterium]
MSNASPAPTTREVVRPLLITVPTWLLAAVFAGPVGMFVAAMGALAGPHRPLMKAMRQSENRLVAASTPGLHLCLMTFPWLLPWLSLDVRSYLAGEGTLGGFLPYVVITAMTALAVAAVCMIEEGSKQSGEQLGPIAREATVLAAYCLAQFFSASLYSGMLANGTADLPGSSSDAGFPMYVFLSMAYYLMLFGIRTYINRPLPKKDPSQ